jgi:hypothetical protein
MLCSISQIWWERSNPFVSTCRPTERNLPLNCRLELLNALIMQHRDNYFVLYLHRYKETGLTRWCFFLLCMFLYLINPCLG